MAVMRCITQHFNTEHTLTFKETTFYQHCFFSPFFQGFSCFFLHVFAFSKTSLSFILLGEMCFMFSCCLLALIVVICPRSLCFSPQGKTSALEQPFSIQRATDCILHINYQCQRSRLRFAFHSGPIPTLLALHA